TPMINSLTLTTPSPLQSPTHAAVAAVSTTTAVEIQVTAARTTFLRRRATRTVVSPFADPRSSFLRSIEGQGAERCRVLARRFDVTEAGAFEQCWKTAVDIVADTLVAVYEMRQESSEATRRRPEVDDVKTAAGTQDAMDLGEA